MKWKINIIGLDILGDLYQLTQITRKENIYIYVRNWTSRSIITAVDNIILIYYITIFE